jgi:glycosyltransferase involved in cell wall biosynthesis
VRLADGAGQGNQKTFFRPPPRDRRVGLKYYRHSSGKIVSTRLPKRLAIFSPGGIGGGAFSQGLPAIQKLVTSLAERFDVTFYSLARVDPSFHPAGYRLRCPPSSVEAVHVRGGRWAALAGAFCADHLRRPFDATLSLWGYPTGPFVVALSALFRLPSAVVLLGAETADLPTLGYGHLGRRRAKRLLFWACRRAAALVAVSQYQLDILQSHGFRRDDARVIPIGAEAELFGGAGTDRARTEPLKLIHVANLTDVKDQATLLRAFALVRATMNARLRIVGDGPLRAEVEGLIRQLGLENVVEMTGAVPFQIMPEHYRWADMFVLTSLSEGQNRSLTEAALSGVLQVSTPVGHIADLGEAAAVLVRAGDPRDIADRITAMARDAPGWERRVRNAHAWASAHDMSWTIERFAAMLGELTGT